MNLPEPEIGEMPARTAVVMARDFTVAQRGEIPGFYDEYWKRFDDLGDLKHQVVCGISFNMDGQGAFRYGIGVIPHEVPETLPEGFETVALHAGTYAIFRTFGPPMLLPEMFDAIYEKWLPNSGYDAHGAPVIERYPEDPRYGPDGMAMEIWAPIHKV